MLNPGDRIGERYQVKGLLAQGGMSQVYLVHDLKLNGKVWVLKEIEHTGQGAAFVEEAKLLTSLSHPYIPNITDYFEVSKEGLCYLVMEYIDGVTLQTRFEQASSKLREQDILKYLIQLCEVLQYLHGREQPVVFRDLKPSNIMVDAYDNIRLIDFGIARSFEAGKLTDTVQMGTVAFAAPEQFEAVQTDPRTDIYAVGAIMYYLLSGGKYYYASAARKDVLTHMPSTWVSLMNRLLAADPVDRYQRVEEVLAALKQIQAGGEKRQHTQLQSLKQTSHLGNQSPIDRTVVLRPGPAHRTHPDGTARIFPGAAPVQSAPYTKQATQSNPALIIYLLDVSGSMTMQLRNQTRLDLVTESLYAALKQMVFRSTKGSRISPRYRISIMTYSDQVEDVTKGIQPIDVWMSSGNLPVLKTYRFTDAAKAFAEAERLLQAELPAMQDSPAPLVCHMTDGAYTGDDPLPIARRIMELSVKDGPVLIENIFISDDVLEDEVTNPKRWPGVLDDTVFRDEYGAKLREMSSIIPDSYRQMMREAHYHLDEGAYMMFPGANPELVSLGFQMSAATPIR